jgi:hypothetical protein
MSDTREVFFRKLASKEQIRGDDFGDVGATYYSV